MRVGFIKRLSFLLLVAVICTGCRKAMDETDKLDEKEKNTVTKKEKSPEELLNEEVEMYLGKMTLEEKVAQLFVVTPEALTGVSKVIQAGETTRNAINAIPVGGFIYMGQNLESTQQTKEMIANAQKYSEERIGLPLFAAVDEEGGTVVRIGGKPGFGIQNVGNMSEIGSKGNVQKAYEVGSTIGAYLSDLGFNLDFAPDADVLSNPDNQVVRYRSFGADPNMVSDMSLAVLQGLQEKGVYGTLKHFPGHGATKEDSHEGMAYTDKTLAELQACELVPFQKGIDEGVAFIMAGHISLPNVTGDNTPACLSKVIITDVLRTQMGYEGIVITDSLSMGAISQQYSPAEAVIQAICAGVDLLLMPQDFEEAYNSVICAVENGTIMPERIDESVRRVLKVKVQMKK